MNALWLVTDSMVRCGPRFGALQIAEKRQHRGDRHHDREHDAECHPAPNPDVEKFGKEEEEKNVEQNSTTRARMKKMLPVIPSRRG